ncbi:hypothetical protein MPNT_10101 [Candidatus Methylacidithermus pantelleriae]|uniref:Uncharacterized protein n=1 Tax=Candidatus Methylacidithermus pantelleriae TaxID=2744239 RepID=A0A8J2BJ61_9BACT|nr:hypothetical protein MPNT_10101 [Candidatus Methylacidithermus pantelleriae]
MGEAFVSSLLGFGVAIGLSALGLGLIVWIVEREARRA